MASGLGLEEGSSGCTERESGRRLRGWQTQAGRAASTGSIWACSLAGTHWMLVDWPGQQWARQLGSGHPVKGLVTKIRELGSGQHTRISQSAFLTAPLPSMFHMERFRDHIISRNATRCVTSLRLITHHSTLKVWKVLAGKNLTSFSPAIPSHLT